MWNKRPEEELPNKFELPIVGTTPITTGDIAVIGKGVKIVGQIYTSQDLLIEGFVQGSVEALNQKLTVGEKGTLHANVQVGQLDVHGTLEGNVDACERIDVRQNARLVGDVKAARIVLEDGAYFKGKMDIVRPEPAAKPQAA